VLAFFKAQFSIMLTHLPCPPWGYNTNEMFMIW
jgi:hypothetical protein